MGRRSKLTPELRDRIVDYISQGNYIEIAARACGINDSTFWDWMKKGETAASGKYRDFWEAVRSADAHLESSLVRDIASDDDYKAKLEVLQRRFRERWSKTVDVTSGGEKIQLTIAQDFVPVESE